MPPEYAIEGIFSTRSDVFSFGVLLLEIVSGKRNNHFSHDESGPSSLVTWVSLEIILVSILMKPYLFEVL